MHVINPIVFPGKLPGKIPERSQNEFLRERNLADCKICTSCRLSSEQHFFRSPYLPSYHIFSISAISVIPYNPSNYSPSMVHVCSRWLETASNKMPHKGHHNSLGVRMPKGMEGGGCHWLADPLPSLKQSKGPLVLLIFGACQCASHFDFL